MNETRDDITDGADDNRLMRSSWTTTSPWFASCKASSFKAARSNAEPLREVSSSWLQIKDLARLQNVANQKLARKFQNWRRLLEEDYEVSFELITTGTLTEAAQHDLQTFQEELAKLSENEAFDATIHVINADELSGCTTTRLKRTTPASTTNFRWRA